MRNFILLILGVVVLAVAIVLFSRLRPATVIPPATSVTPTITPEVTPQETNKNVKTFTVEGKSFSFSPKEIKVKQGDTVRIVFKNTGGFHDWTLDEFKAQTKQISTGESDTVEFVAEKKGSFELFCSVGNHRQLGMKGTLIVE